jgi:hypothetical protein
MASMPLHFAGRLILAGWLCLFNPIPDVRGAELYVDPSGDDTQPGTRRKPFASLAAAQSAARAFAGREKVTVHVAPGTYFLPGPLVFTPVDSGTQRHPVLYRAAREGEAVLSGGQPLKLQWTPFREGILRATTPEGLQMDQLFIDGRRQWMARYPNREDRPGLNVFDCWRLDEQARPGPAEDALAPGRIARWKDPAGGYVHAMHSALWGDMHWRITGRAADGKLAMEGGWQNNRPSGMHPVYRFVENIFEELDAPGEWFHDAATRTLYFKPPAGIDLERARVEVVRLKHLVEFQGDAAHPIRHIELRGFVFRHAARTFMENREPLLRSDWTTYRGGAILLKGTEDCAVRDATFDQVGGNTIFVDGYNRRFTARGLLIRDSGANGIAFVGNPAAVRSPIFRYGPQNYASLDRTPGPIGEDFPADCLVEDCLITRTGRDEKQTAPVQISMALGITVRHCSIYEVPRAGINISEGTWGGHVVEHCDVFDTVLETGDHGSFNSWGRDRFWHPDVHAVDRQVAADPGLPFLDVIRPIVLRNNRWRCDHGWDVDLDDGSSRYEISSNLFLNGGLKLREGFQRHVWNNITVNNTLHPHVWFERSQDRVTGNIWMGAYRPAGGMPKGRWGDEVDRNLFTTSESDRARFAAHGCDAGSLVGDATFLDPARGDYRVRPRSPATQLGFANFPMNTFGVRKPALKALARTPRLPEIAAARKPPAGDAATPITTPWRGAALRDLAEGEYSAFGIARHPGGVVAADVPAHTEAANNGLRTGDILQAVNGEPTPTLAAFFRVLGRKRPARADITLSVTRAQEPITLKLKPAP